MTRRITETLDQVCIDPRAGPDTLDRMADECVEMGVAAFCVYPWWVERVAKRMGDRVATSGIVSMPIGLEGTAAKVAATLDCVASGATEIDFLAAWSAILYGDLDAAIRDAAAVVEAAKSENPDVITKAIIESPEMEQVSRKAGGCLPGGCRVGRRLRQDLDRPVDVRGRHGQAGAGDAGGAARPCGGEGRLAGHPHPGRRHRHGRSRKHQAGHTGADPDRPGRGRSSGRCPYRSRLQWLRAGVRLGLIGSRWPVVGRRSRIC